MPVDHRGNVIGRVRVGKGKREGLQEQVLKTIDRHIKKKKLFSENYVYRTIRKNLMRGYRD